MKAIKMWCVSQGREGPSVREINSTHQTESEHMLEELLVRCPDLLMQDLVDLVLRY